MALQLEGISVVIPLSKIYAVYEGGKEAFWRDTHPSEGECDGEILRTSFSNSTDVECMIEDWKRRGLKPTRKQKGQICWQDLCVVDLFCGPTLPCDWLEYDREKCTAKLKQGGSQMNSELVTEVVSNLQLSPLFQLSLGSKELFHSNFLAWCCETWRKEMGEVWSELLCKPSMSIKCDVGKFKAVRREYKNHDLEIDFEDETTLLIELKVKSVPTQKQLEEYSSGVNSKETLYSLVSLTCPQFFDSEKILNISENVKWCWIDLSCVAYKIKDKIQTENCYHRELLSDYAFFVSQLSELMNHIDISPEMDQHFYLSDESDRKLREARLHDLVYKYRYDQLGAKLYDAFHANATSIENAISVKAEMSNGSGLVTIAFSLSNTVDIGIQLQGRQFRQFIAVKDEKMNKTESEGFLISCINELESNGLWFNFIDADFENNRMRKDICQYGGTFIYKYRLVKEVISSSKLVELIIQLIKEAHINREALAKLIITR